MCKRLLLALLLSTIIATVGMPDALAVSPQNISFTVMTASGIKGDINTDGNITIVDALFIAQFTVGNRILTPTQLVLGDVNTDGNVTIVDALFIAQFTVGNNANTKIINNDTLIGWWLPEWSEDGKDLNVTYNRGKNTVSTNISISNSYDPFGTQINGSEVKQNVGEDVYGRELNTTIVTLSSWRGGAVKPNYTIGNGSIIYPVGSILEQSLFSRRFNIKINNEYDENGNLIGAYGEEEFSGHISTKTEKITYSGYAIGNFTEKDGQVVWTERVEKTNYYHDDKPYAETVTTIIPSSEYLGGKWVKTREDQKTITTYTDGSKRESELIIILQRNEYGVMSGMNGKGVVTGSDIINGNNINYTGSIVINYGIKSNIGWYKIGYDEIIYGSGRSLKYLPFESIYISDIYLRPIF